MTRPLARSRGLTLAEMVITLAVTSVVLATVLSVVVGQQRAMQSTEAQRASTAGGRDAFFELERSLHKAGFGVDPRFAFDFTSFRCTNKVSGVGGKQVCRDRTDGPDELVFVGRNPYYRVDFQGTNGCALASGCPTGLAWSVSAATAGGTPSITLQLRAGQLLEYGRSLLVTCSGGGRYTMATVGANVTAGANGNTVVPLYATSVTNPYFENNFADPCFTGGNALAFAMDRYRYFIRTFGNVPWLMLDTGLDLNGDNQDPWLVEDAKDLLPIAPYVEDLQVAYVLNRLSGGTAPDTNQNWVVGDDRSLIGTSEEPDPAATAPTYPVPYNDPTRANLHPANIRELRIALSLRSERRDQSQPASWLGDQLPVLENETLVLTAAQLGRYHRQRLISTLSVRNLQSHGMFAF